MTHVSRRRFLSLGGGLLGAAALAGCASPGSNLLSVAQSKPTFRTETPEERRRNRFVNNSLVTQHGQTVRFYDDLIKGKTVMFNFMYTQCQNEGFCPMMAFNLSKVQALLGDRLGKEVFMYSISLDPDTDTPALMDNYGKHFKAKEGGWTFLTGTKVDIQAVRESLGFIWANPEQDKLKQEHIGILKYGNEPLERWGTCPALTKPEAIVAYLEWMMPNGQRPMG